MVYKFVYVVVGSVLFLGACSSSDGNDPNTDAEEVTNAIELNVDSAPSGSITHYGVVTISDDEGQAYDLIGSFFRLGRGVSSEFLTSMLSGDAQSCKVQGNEIVDLTDISVGYIPQIVGVTSSSVAAGASIVLSSSEGVYATLQEQPAAGFLFYDLDNMLMSGAIPENLTVDVAGSSEIPQFTGVSVPQISALLDVDYGNAGTIAAETTFSWTPSGNPNALVRIHTSTAGGFFLEDSVTIECLVPDNGAFNFPANEQALLGSDFVGEPPILSRLAVNPVESGSTMLYVIRESFAAED